VVGAGDEFPEASGSPPTDAPGTGVEFGGEEEKNGGADERGVSAQDVDGYLAAVPEDARVSFGKLRETIRAVVPDATEAISYQIPIFKHRGRGLVGFSASKDHCTFQVMSRP
jgi:hypothetical protein